MRAFILFVVSTLSFPSFAEIVEGFDCGYSGTRYLEDVDNDGTPDYCRTVGDYPKTFVSCARGLPNRQFSRGDDIRLNRTVSSGHASCPILVQPTQSPRGRVPRTQTETTRSNIGAVSITPASTTPGSAESLSESSLSQGLRITPKGTILHAPKGYEHIKPAQLYSIDIQALGDPRWIIARSKGEAIEIGKRFYSFYTDFNACLAHGCKGLNPIEFDFGWVAIIQAFRPPIKPGDKREFGVYGAQAAPSRQAAINGALAEYRSKRGSDGPIIQSIRVGLVSEMNWPEIEASSGDGIPHMGMLNYYTFCEWAGPGGTNFNPEPTTGDLDNDPGCKTSYKPVEKLPPPVLIIKKRGM